MEIPGEISSWNDDYGDWQGLASPTEAPRYQEIVRVIDRFCPEGSVLDVGCGEAVLKAYLRARTRYLGIEPSAKAAQSARTRYGSSSVHHSNGESFDPGKSLWECIVFNETLYYCTDPVGLLKKYAKFLNPGGIVVVSIYQRKERPKIGSLFTRVLSSRRPLTNAHCTRMVRDLIVRDAWQVQEDKPVAIPGRGENWRILVAKPHK